MADCNIGQTGQKEKRIYSVNEIAQILNISRGAAYELCRDAPFKVVKIGKCIRISKFSFDSWLDKTMNKEN